jgi:hypothetical protein
MKGMPFKYDNHYLVLITNEQVFNILKTVN